MAEKEKSMELEDKLYEKIVEWSEDGDAMLEEEDFDGAIEKYQSALELLPEPKYDWEAGTWLYAALGDANYLSSRYSEAEGYLQEALKCLDGLGNPFILLRLGECYYELDNMEKAKEYLLQAYMCEGEDIFEDEEEKYFDAVKDMI